MSAFMNRFRRHIEEKMYEDAGKPLFSSGALLRIGACGYGAGAVVKDLCYRTGLFRPKRLPCRVISIGNITLGGTGKTPMALYVARAVRKMGYRAAVLSRGYKGDCERTGGVVSDGETIRMDPEQAGDEPYLLASKLPGVPVLVGKDRFETGRFAVQNFDTEVLVLDDGFQHVRLGRDIDLLLLDDRRPFGNGHLFPGGTLREPLAALARADAFVLTRTGLPEPGSFYALCRMARHRPVFRSYHRAKIQAILAPRAPLAAGSDPIPPAPPIPLSGPENPAPLPVFLFSGIANNRDFQDTARKFFSNVKGDLAYPDHHRYTAADLDRIVRTAAGSGAEALVTTEKDYVRIAHSARPFPMKLIVIGVEIVFEEDSDAFHRFLKNRLERAWSIEQRAESEEQGAKRPNGEEITNSKLQIPNNKTKICR